MTEITFREFFEYNYREDGFHESYIMKNGRKYLESLVRCERSYYQ
jgi:hypothetical protein